MFARFAKITIQLNQRRKELRAQLQEFYKRRVEPVFSVNASQGFDVTSRRVTELGILYQKRSEHRVRPASVGWVSAALPIAL